MNTPTTHTPEQIRFAQGLADYERESDQQLMRFYSAETLHELIDAQERHISKLQSKLPPLRDESPRNPRVG